MCLVKAGRVVELAGLLRLQGEVLGGRRDKPLEASGLVAALSSLPQCADIAPLDGADLVDAAAPLIALPTALSGNAAQVGEPYLLPEPLST